MSLQGTIETFAVADVLRLLAATAKSGRLQIQGPTRTGTVWVDGGRILAAEVPAVTTDGGAAEAVFQLLRLERGSFRFELDKYPPNPAEPVEIELALGDAESMLAEWRELETTIPSSDSWLTLRAELDAPVSITPEQWKVVAAIAGGSTVADVATTLKLGELAAMRSANGVIHAGVATVGTRPAASVTQVPQSVAPAADANLVNEVTFDAPALDAPALEPPPLEALVSEPLAIEAPAVQAPVPPPAALESTLPEPVLPPALVVEAPPVPVSAPVDEIVGGALAPVAAGPGALEIPATPIADAPPPLPVAAAETAAVAEAPPLPVAEDMPAAPPVYEAPTTVTPLLLPPPPSNLVSPPPAPAAHSDGANLNGSTPTVFAAPAPPPATAPGVEGDQKAEAGLANAAPPPPAAPPAWAGTPDSPSWATPPADGSNGYPAGDPFAYGQPYPAPSYEYPNPAGFDYGQGGYAAPEYEYPAGFDYTQPAGDYAQPGAEYAQPGFDYGQPVADYAPFSYTPPPGVEQPAWFETPGGLPGEGAATYPPPSTLLPPATVFGAPPAPVTAEAAPVTAEAAPITAEAVPVEASAPVEAPAAEAAPAAADEGPAAPLRFDPAPVSPGLFNPPAPTPAPPAPVAPAVTMPLAPASDPAPPEAGPSAGSAAAAAALVAPPPPPPPSVFAVTPSAPAWGADAQLERIAPPPPPPPAGVAASTEPVAAAVGIATDEASAAEEAANIERQLFNLSERARDAVRRSSGLFDGKSRR